MHIKVEDFLKIIEHCTLVHHIKGRLRVRVSHNIKDEIKNLGMNLDDFKDLDFDDVIKNIDGINKIKLNKLVGSITIEYDNNILPKKMWDDALNGENLDTLVANINKKIKDIA